jgi:hypothetical protein
LSSIREPKNFTCAKVNAAIAPHTSVSATVSDAISSEFPICRQ